MTVQLLAPNNKQRQTNSGENRTPAKGGEGNAWLFLDDRF